MDIQYSQATVVGCDEELLDRIRLKDRVHLLDMIDVGLLDNSWCERFLPELAERLQELPDNPDA